jgi:hypothetical protein
MASFLRDKDLVLCANVKNGGKGGPYMGAAMTTCCDSRLSAWCERFVLGEYLCNVSKK